MTKEAENEKEIDPKLSRYLHALSSVCLNQKRLAYYLAIHEYNRLRDTFLRLRIDNRWDTGDATKTKERLTWFLEHGQRTEFDRHRHVLSTLSDANRSNYIASLKKGDLESARQLVVYAYMNRLPHAGIAAFDYAWYLIICKAGAQQSYLPKAEAVEGMLDVAKRIQLAYSSWEEYLFAYACGNLYDEAGASKNTRKATEAHILKLLTGKYSPIREFDWKFDLTPYLPSPHAESLPAFSS
ncbi:MULTISPECIES: DUF1266 domain-containing protein [Brevibacillus]|uniref:DUF1266 domain-containing protein n=1 Tax=Brevibacillus TaxID=55080 RepID=UPI00156AA9E3|nr:DUF1266 domain-containing protein [Brevibacillus sp. RS1.1]NRR01839.1 DUF1266 domain-containing protein [Brevibacillus sp. RS1.1]